MSKFMLCILFGAMLSVASAGAEAKIICHGGYQVSNGQEIATPFCDDAALAAAARNDGAHVSDNAIRNDPGVKDSVCSSGEALRS